MTPEIRFFLSIIGIIIGFIGYYPYFRDIYKGKTKPHAFSWLIWGILTGIGTVIQIYEKGGLGSWVLGTTSIICFIIFIIGVYQKQIIYSLIDWLSLLLAGISLYIWYITETPFYSVLLIAFIDFIGFIPTYRKIYYMPNSETLSSWYMMDLKILIGIIALNNYGFNLIFYPSVVFILNALAIIMIHLGRNKKILQNCSLK